MTLKIKTCLFISFILISVIPLVVIGGFSYYLIFEKISKQNEETITNINKGIYNTVDIQQKVLSRWLESSAASFSGKLAALGESRFDYDNTTEIGAYRLPTWYIGRQKITGDYALVDGLIEKEKLPATIFQLHNNKFVRVSTNVRQADGSRITGTVLDTGPVYERLINGQKFIGRANVEGIWHATIYQPIWDSNGKLIGAFVLGRREQEYELVNAIKNIVVGETGYVFVMDANGVAIIHPTLQGKSLSEYPWAREILQKKNGTITYTDPSGREQIAYYMYYEPWNWYIVTGGYVAEIYNTTRKLSQLLLLAVLAVIGISALIAYFLSNSFSKPINELMAVIRNCQSGNLSTRLNLFSHEEFRIVSSAFNNMLNNISLLISRILTSSNKIKEASQRLMVDIAEASHSVKGMESGVDSLRQISERCNPEITSYNMIRKFAELQQLVGHVKLLLENASQHWGEDQLQPLERAISKLEELQQSLADFTSGNTGTSTVVLHPVVYLNKINNLEVEVQKLKLLLKNISSSASTLDDIALALDRNINVFKIDNNAE